MSHRDSLTGCARRLSRSSGHISGRCVGREGGRAGLCHRDLAPRPGPRLFDRPTRAAVTGLCLLERAEHVLGAMGRPHGKKAMVGVLERAAAPHGDESRVSLLRKDDLSLDLRSFCGSLSAQQPASDG